ncbi:MAG: hypothetical protein V1722_01470 [Candidatus Micrarchaeota archaeon]
MKKEEKNMSKVYPLFQFLTGEHAPKLTVKRDTPDKIVVKIRNPTAANRRIILEAITATFGKPTGSVYCGRQKIRAPWGVAQVTIGEPHMNVADHTFTIYKKYRGEFNRLMAERSNREARAD